MTTVYLIRHAEAEGNLYRVVQGQANSNLTNRGWRQVRALERRFADIHVDAVYTSDLYRTWATAGAVYKPKELPVHRMKELREIYVGDWEHKTWGDVYRLDPEQMACFSRQIDKWKVLGAETPQQVRRRIMDALKKIIAENEGRTVAVFSHGYVLRLLLGTLQGYDLSEIGQTTHGDNTAVSMLEADGEQIRVVFRDDNSHLKTPEYLAGEKVMRRATALEPGLWFRSFWMKRQEELFVQMAEQAWEDAGEPRTFDREKLLQDAAVRTNLVGYLRDEPVGMIQIGPEKEWVTMTYMREDVRTKGFGTQLIGQAVLLCRARGGEYLRTAVRQDSSAMPFYLDNGFLPVETAEDDRVILEKDIRFDPAFPGLLTVEPVLG